MLPEKTSTTSAAQLRARIARASKAGDLDEVAAARSDYRVHQLEDHITRVLGEAPPLTEEQRDRLRALLAADGSAS